MNADLEMFCHRLLGALFNGGYQGLALTTVIWVGVKIVPRGNAATRHMVWLVTLLFVASLPAVHFLLPGPAGNEAQRQEDSIVTNWPLAAGNTVGSWKDRSTASSGVSVSHPEPAAWEINFPERVASSRSKDLLQLSEKEAALQSIPEAGSKNSAFAKAPSPVERDSGKAFPLARFRPVIPWNWRLSLPDRMVVALIALWIGVASWRLGVLAWQSSRLHCLKRRGTAAPEDLRTLFEALSEEMGLRRKTHLLTCHESTAPIALGFRRPAVLLPAMMFEGAEELQLEQVLRHELAHVSRGDDWANLIQQVIKALLFFHPAIWWLSRRLTVEREIACDDHVLAATQTPRAYALFLTEFASRMQGRELAAAPAAWSSKNQLTERITMILDSNRNSSPRLARARAGVLTMAAALVAILVLQAGPRLVLAAQEPTESDPTPAAITNENQISLVEPAVAESTVESIIESESAALQALIAATDDPPAPSPVAIESGPRPKPQPVPEAPQVAPVPALAPLPPRAPHGVNGPALAAAPVAISVPAAPRLGAVTAEDAPAQPAPVSPPRSKRSGDSIERRLERLEQLVDSLLAREKAPKKRTEVAPDFNFNLKLPAADFDKEKFAKLAEEQAKLAEKFKLKTEDLARIKDQASREAERAVRQAERAVRDVERASAEAQDRAKIEERRAEAGASRAGARDAFEKQRQALEAQRKSLEKQMEAVERQIQRLEKEQQKAEEQRSDREKRLKQDPKSDSAKPEDSDSKDGPKAKK